LCAIDKNDKSNLIYFYIIYLISSKFEFCANKFIYIIENLICLLYINIYLIHSLDGEEMREAAQCVCVNYFIEKCVQAMRGRKKKKKKISILY